MHHTMHILDAPGCLESLVIVINAVMCVTADDDRYRLHVLQIVRWIVLIMHVIPAYSRHV